MKATKPGTCHSLTRERIHFTRYESNLLKQVHFVFRFHDDVETDVTICGHAQITDFGFINKIFLNEIYPQNGGVQTVFHSA